MAPEVVQRAPSPKVDNVDKGKVETLSDENKANVVLGEAAKLEEDEVYDELMHKAFKAQIDGIGKTMMEQEREDGILANRSKQAVLYFAFSELRIAELERELHEVKQDLYDNPGAYKMRRRKKSHPVYQHLTQRSSPSQFRITKQSFDVPYEKRAALEVLIVEKIHKKQQVQSGIVNDREVTVHWCPEQLRIRSRPLISHLQKISATQLSNFLYAPTRDEPESSTVFLTPFKFFVMFEKEIRQSIGDVEAEVQKEEEGNSSPRAHSGPKRSFNEPDFDNKDLLEDLKVLIKFMDEEMHPIFDLRRSIEDGAAKEIAYADLWHLFRRGDIVLIQADPSHTYKAVQFAGGREPLVDRLSAKDDEHATLDGFSVDCLSIESDGSSYVPRLTTVSILPYLGCVPITSLSVYPLRFDPKAATKRADFIKQGRQYMDLTTEPYAHKHFMGKTLDEPSHDLDAQVIVDMTLAIHSNPAWKPKHQITLENLTQFDKRETQISPYCHHNRYDEGCCGSDHAHKDWEMDQVYLNEFAQENRRLFIARDAKGLTEEDLMMLPKWVYGFVLRIRRWITMRIVDLYEVRFENDFSKLMLSEEHKETIQALVKTHENARGGFTEAFGSVGSAIDLVRGKGTGLILLLHGAPGVGKTSTAECVADNTKRPLFPVTCGDIGETAMEVERNLQHNFRLAHKWGCVLLLDEADVFLAKRTKLDLRRNAVTSVFLRSLEYYAGILFLTSNRVGHIDPAFKSRFHLSLRYEPFNLRYTQRLYGIFIDRTREEQKRRGPAHFLVKRKEILAFAKENYREMKGERLGVWNGRQIRNAFQAAISLAEHDYQKKLVDGKYPEGKPLPQLGRSQLATVADRSKEFDKYLVETLGMAESDLAHEEQWRADRFSKEKRAATRTAAAAAARNKTKIGNAPDVTSSEDEDETSLSEDDEDGYGGGGGGGGNMGEDAEGSDLDDEEELEAIREMMRRKKKNKGKK